jgi:hypothetical protein
VNGGGLPYYHPETGEKREMKLPAGGRGYLRPSSLAGLWYTVPYLNNNSVGRCEAGAAVAARLAAFQDGMEQLLWPEKRDKDEKWDAMEHAGSRRQHGHGLCGKLRLPWTKQLRLSLLFWLATCSRLRQPGCGALVG